MANNRQRLAYPEYWAAGWHSGSGVVESACQTAVQRATEAAGTRVGILLDRGAVLGDPAPWDWQKDAAGKTCA